MNAVPIVQCAQCPGCRGYVPIPSDLLKSLIPAPNVNPPSFFSINDSTSGLIHRTNIPPIQPVNPMIIQPPIIPMVKRPNDSYSEYENSWRSTFLKLPVLIHGIVEIVLTALILILEIASLGVSTYSATGAGIWCAIPFMTAGILTVLLALKWDRSRLWATRVCIAQIVLLVFCFILIGIVGNFVQTQQGISSLYGTKYQIMQAQLAFGILLLFAGFAYIIFYGVTTYLALWKPFNTLDTPHLFRE